MLMRLTACAMGWGRNHGTEYSGLSLAVCGPKFMKFWDDVGDASYFQRPCPIVYVTFRSKDIRH